eukprot:2388520-Alexandrium_andersonii.AAC.1
MKPKEVWTAVPLVHHVDSFVAQHVLLAALAHRAANPDPGLALRRGEEAGVAGGEGHVHENGVEANRQQEVLVLVELPIVGLRIQPRCDASPRDGTAACEELVGVDHGVGVKHVPVH